MIQSFEICHYRPICQLTDLGLQLSAVTTYFRNTFSFGKNVVKNFNSPKFCSCKGLAKLQFFLLNKCFIKYCVTVLPGPKSFGDKDLPSFVPWDYENQSIGYFFVIIKEGQSSSADPVCFFLCRNVLTKRYNSTVMNVF